MDSPRQADHDPTVHLGQLKRFSLRELKFATNGFSDQNILGRGGSGKVYKGRLADGSLVAVKRLKGKRTPAWELQFQTEMEIISMAVHRNLLRLRGFCMTPTERLFVYPHIENGSVASCLRERPPNKPPLDWPTRKQIALGSARGLSYLHDHCDPKIIHRDVKAANILLDEDFEAMVADFGSVKLMDYKDTHVNTGVVHGTIGHIAPEYLSDGKLSEKTDVYGYGIMLLELITGQRAFDLACLANDDDVMMLDWVKGLLKEKKHEMLVDPGLQNNYVEPEVEQLIQVALLCTEGSPMDRPKMSEVVRMLEGDGLAEKWYEWQKGDVICQEVELAPHPNSDWIVDSTENLHIVELSGPRSRLSLSTPSSPLLPSLLLSSPLENRVHRANSKLAVGAQHYSKFDTSTPMDSPRQAKHDLEVNLVQLKRFSLKELQVATNYFSDQNILGRGGSGKVYKGRLADGTLVAVKRLKEKRTPARELQFQTEMEIISMAVHRNLLRLRGFCMTPTERLLVYPYMENGSVASCLRERPSNKPPLDWPTRRQIALDSAKGLSYLHDHCDPKIIHCGVKAANILLDKEFEAVVADFGSAKLMDYKDTHISTCVLHGTIGHIAPEYLSDGKLSEKTDVYGYGIMLLELITGHRAFDLARLANDDDMMLDWVEGLLKEKKHEILVDPDLQNNYVGPQVEQLIQVALLCTQGSPVDRPKMSEVVGMLEGGFAEKWHEWQKVELVHEPYPHPNKDWIIGSWIPDSTENLQDVELSGPR